MGEIDHQYVCAPYGDKSYADAIYKNVSHRYTGQVLDDETGMHYKTGDITILRSTGSSRRTAKRRNKIEKRCLTPLIQKLSRGERLDYADGVALYQTGDILRLGELARQYTLKRYGPKVYYSINRHINYTNICRVGCRFCGFSRRLGQEGGYLMSASEVAELAEKARRQGANEVHIVGGIHPELSFDYYREMIEQVRRRCPKMHIKAFTAVEIIEMADKGKLTVEEVLQALKEAGLQSLPGGGAEILDEEYFQKACPNKPGPGKWLEVHAAAHRLGLMTNATMLYGYIDTPEQRIKHLLTLRKQQDESIQLGKGRFQCFVPLTWLDPNKGYRDTVDGLTKLKTIAISRLMLDNIEHIKAFWPMLGVKLAQVGLAYGADDLEGTVQQYRIVDKKQEGADQQLSVAEIRALISETGRSAVQRDGFYRAPPAAEIVES